jgi:hypothetical protein
MDATQQRRTRLQKVVLTGRVSQAGAIEILIALLYRHHLYPAATTEHALNCLASLVSTSLEHAAFAREAGGEDAINTLLSVNLHRRAAATLTPAGVDLAYGTLELLRVTEAAAEEAAEAAEAATAATEFQGTEFPGLAPPGLSGTTVGHVGRMTSPSAPRSGSGRSSNVTSRFGRNVQAAALRQAAADDSASEARRAAPNGLQYPYDRETVQAAMWRLAEVGSQALMFIVLFGLSTKLGTRWFSNGGALHFMPPRVASALGQLGQHQQALCDAEGPEAEAEAEISGSVSTHRSASPMTRRRYNAAALDLDTYRRTVVGHDGQAGPGMLRLTLGAAVLTAAGRCLAGRKFSWDFKTF